VPLLGPGEATILSERTESGSGRNGILTLTSVRLVFEGRKKQRIVTELVRGEKLVTFLDVRLDLISNLHRDKPLIGRATLRVEAAGQGHIYKVKDVEEWVSAISRARQQVRPMADHYGHVVVNVAAPSVAAPVQSFLHCAHCGSLVPTGAAGPGGCDVQPAGLRCEPSLFQIRVLSLMMLEYWKKEHPLVSVEKNPGR
jgi:hypothetical protein